MRHYTRVLNMGYIRFHNEPRDYPDICMKHVELFEKLQKSLKCTQSVFTRSVHVVLAAAEVAAINAWNCCSEDALEWCSCWAEEIFFALCVIRRPTIETHRCSLSKTFLLDYFPNLPLSPSRMDTKSTPLAADARANARSCSSFSSHNIIFSLSAFP